MSSCLGYSSLHNLLSPRTSTSRFTQEVLTSATTLVRAMERPVVLVLLLVVLVEVTLVGVMAVGEVVVVVVELARWPRA